MTEHDDREAHEAKADELERELDDMQERSERLGGDIEGTEEDWERRKRDEGVPGATGEPADGGDEDDGDADADAAELDFGRGIESEAVVAEDGPPPQDEDDEEKDEEG